MDSHTEHWRRSPGVAKVFKAANILLISLQESCAVITFEPCLSFLQRDNPAQLHFQVGVRCSFCFVVSVASEVRRKSALKCAWWRKGGREGGRGGCCVAVVAANTGTGTTPLMKTKNENRRKTKKQKSWRSQAPVFQVDSLK